MSNCSEFDTLMSNKRKSVMIDEDIEEQKKQKIIDDEVSPSHLPEDLVLGNILTRVSAKDLARFTSVSKSWYNSTLNDTQFAISHFAHHRNRRNLSFNLLNVSSEDDEDGVFRNYFFNLQKDNSNQHDNDHFYNFERVGNCIGSKGSIEPVGNCNGLACVKHPRKSRLSEAIIVTNPFRSEMLTLNYIIPKIGGEGGSLGYLCHGFGFDSLSQDYKIVMIYTTSTADGDSGFMCMVFTLGDTVWRKIVTSTSEMSPPPGRSSFPSRMVIEVSEVWRDIFSNRSATICGGDLLWRLDITSPDNDYDYDDKHMREFEMLLSFDIHNEKIQFIRPPNECNSLIMSLDNLDGFEDLSECHHLCECRHHLLEFKGYPCVARSDKIWIGERVETHSYGLRFICYQFKVHLYILKDKVKQMWTQEETFDVRFVENSVNPGSISRDPFERYFHKTELSSNQRSHRTRLFSFSDQVMLYWFDGGCLIFYNLRMKHHNVVKGTYSCNKRNRDIFEAKITGLPDPDSHYDVPECPCTDYQLHAQAENIISLRSFISKATKVVEFDCYKEFQQFARDKQPVGWVDTGRKSPKWYAFF